MLNIRVVEIISKKCSDLQKSATNRVKGTLTLKQEMKETKIMETRKDETYEVIIFNVKLSKKQLQILRTFITITTVAGIILFFVKHF